MSNEQVGCEDMRNAGEPRDRAGSAGRYTEPCDSPSMSFLKIRSSDKSFSAPS